MIEVFKTNITEIDDADHLTEIIRSHFPGYRVTFDLEDCDRILRVAAGEQIQIGVIIRLAGDHGFRVSPLPD